MDKKKRRKDLVMALGILVGFTVLLSLVGLFT